MKSLKLQIISLSMALLLLPISVTALYFFVGVRGQMFNNARSTIDFYIQQFEKDTNGILNDIKNTAMFILSGKDVYDILATEEDYDRVLAGEIQDRIASSVMYNSAWDRGFINGIFIFKDEDTYFSTFRNTTYSAAVERNRRVYGDYKDSPSLRRIVRPDYSDRYGYYVLNVGDNVTLEPIGKIIIEIDLTRFVDVGQMRSLYPQSQVFVTGLDGHILFSTVADIDEISQFPLDKDYYTYEAHNMGYEMKMSIFVPQKDIFWQADNTISIYLLLSALAVLLTGFVSIFAYRSILRPLSQVEHSLQKISQGDFSARMEQTRYKETNTIVNTFNKMADNMDDLFAEVYEKGVQLTRTELQMLQSQINPHFIFNVLEVINMRAMELGADSICAMIQNLAQLIRSNILLKGQEKVTLRQELNYVSYYLLLQKERFGHRLSFYFDCADEELQDCLVPKLLIQPLVENAVVHGLEPRGCDGLISVKIWEEDEGICIKISDNGVGFDTGAAMAVADKNHNHLALSNIQRRLSLIYGKHCEFKIESQKGQGTHIHIILPIEKGENHA